MWGLESPRRRENWQGGKPCPTGRMEELGWVWSGSHDAAQDRWKREKKHCERRISERTEDQRMTQPHELPSMRA